jgi:hypothetical protein
MRTIAVSNPPDYAQSQSTAIGAPQALAVWLLPLLYPLSIAAIVHSAAFSRSNAALGIPLLALSIAWSVAGPLAGWLTLNYLDQNKFDRGQCRLVVHGALMAAAAPPLFTGMRQISSHALAAWYVTAAVIATAVLLPVPKTASTVRFRHIHAVSAILIASFALAHVLNHSLGIISIPTHTAVLHVLRLVYRQRVIETLLVIAILGQVCTGSVMVWKSYLRSASPLRNLQILSGLYLAVFLVTHLYSVYTTRQHGIDTDFVWASSAPVGLLGKVSAVPLLPRYTLAVLMVFIHLACQARWNLVRVTSAARAQQISYGLMALGGVASIVIGFAACGVHLMHS